MCLAAEILHATPEQMFQLLITYHNSKYHLHVATGKRVQSQDVKATNSIYFASLDVILAIVICDPHAFSSLDLIRLAYEDCALEHLNG